MPSCSFPGIGPNNAYRIYSILYFRYALYISLLMVCVEVLTCCWSASRGADSQATDREGRTALQYAIDSGTIDDEEILLLLEDPR